MIAWLREQGARHHSGEKLEQTLRPETGLSWLVGHKLILPCGIYDGRKISKRKYSVVMSGINWTRDKKLNQEINEPTSWIFL